MYRVRFNVSIICTARYMKAFNFDVKFSRCYVQIHFGTVQSETFVYITITPFRLKYLIVNKSHSSFCFILIDLSSKIMIYTNIFYRQLICSCEQSFDYALKTFANFESIINELRLNVSHSCLISKTKSCYFPSNGVSTAPVNSH